MSKRLGPFSASPKKLKMAQRALQAPHKVRYITPTSRTRVMGILNVTPDSFSEQGAFLDKDKAVGHALKMARDGAGLIDVGGESTRPGAGEVPVQEELDRVIPVIEEITKRSDIPLSIDTRKSKVAAEALKAGACMVNDVSALTFDTSMGSVVARGKAKLILMHMKGTPRTMQVDPRYGNLMGEIIAGLRSAIRRARSFSIPEEDIIIDPGIGFGKTAEHNLEILDRLDELKILGRPICVGTSRKSFIGAVLGIRQPAGRLAGTLATCAIAIIKGAAIIRVHDVEQAVQAARMTDAVLRRGIDVLQ